LHKYIYANDNPVVYTDPSGLSAFADFGLNSLATASLIEKILLGGIFLTGAVLLGLGTKYAIETLLEVNIPYLEARRGPKTDGGPHNEKIEERVEELKREGKKHVAGGSKTEEVIRIPPGGNKTARRPDITMENPDGSIYRENVGKTKADGTPVKREVEALDDIAQATGKRPTFTPYDR
jgi:hypothetical protein